MNRKILVVEDDIAHIELIQRSIERESTFSVIHAKNLKEAKAFLQNIVFDLILIDWRLPDGQGIDLLKDCEKEIDLPVILMTSYGNETLAVEAIKCGALDYIVKSPETFANLSYFLHKAIREWKLISENKRINEKLKESEELLRAIFDTAKDIIFVKDKELKYKVVNSAFCALHNMNADQIIGKSDKEFYDSSRMGFINNTDLQAINGKLVNADSEFDIGGSKKFINIIKSPLFNDKNEIIGLCGVGRDITDRINFEKDIIEAKEKAIKSEKLKSEFLAQMSHEIRTPINALLSFSGLLKSELEDNVDDELKSIFQYMEQAGKRIIRTIDLLLNMAELQAGSFEVAPSSFNLFPRVLDLMYQENIYEANKKGIEFTIINNLENDEIFADEYSTQQILSNIIENAIKFTASGKVEVLVYKNDNNDIVVEVKDTGIGISQEYLGQLFTPFSQEEQGYTRQFEGNGLGLAIVKRYCELNNAEISVESEKGKGTTFSVIFKQKP